MTTITLNPAQVSKLQALLATSDCVMLTETSEGLFVKPSSGDLELLPPDVADELLPPVTKRTRLSDLAEVLPAQTPSQRLYAIAELAVRGLLSIADMQDRHDPVASALEDALEALATRL